MTEHESRLRIVLDDWVRDDWQDRAASYVAGLPDASGTFSGTFDSAVMVQYWPQPDLLPVEVDTGDRPNPLATALPGNTLAVSSGGRTWRFVIDYAEHLSGNRWRAWCERPEELTS